MWQRPPSIETRRCLLRKFSLNDFDSVHEFGADEEVTRFMDWGPNDAAATRAFLERVVEDGAQGLEFAVVECHTGRLIGSCGIHAGGRSRAEIGYCLEKRAWGRGLGTEVAAALVRFGFDELRLHRIQARCDPMNMASARILEKVGMKYEGRLRECVWVRGEWKDRKLFAVLETDSPRAVG
jgi:[ribosomal protein S5]-alanine N-acetyltransferase